MPRLWEHVPGVQYPDPPARPGNLDGERIRFGLTQRQMDRIREMDRAALKLETIGETVGCSMNTVSKYLRSIGRGRRARNRKAAA